MQSHVYTVWWHGTNVCMPHGVGWVRWLHGMLPCHLYPADMCRYAPIVLCHVSLSGRVAADVDQWVSVTWHVWSHLSDVLRQGGAHLCWHGPRGLWHVAGACWLGPFLCCHVAHPLSSSIMYSLCFLHPVCTQDCCCPQVVPIIALINSFNQFHLLWNSSPCPKIMKFSPKIPKFMMITPVIFNSTFDPVSLH
jgi:hypothetical protein